jgi:tetratricopeptide (TPR) repeat protein
MDRLFSEASSWRAPTLDLAGNEGEITEEESPERQARRLRFRKLVAGVLGMAAVLALAVGLRAPRNQDFASLQGSLAASPEPPTALLHPDANQPVTTARTAEKPAPEPVVAPKEPAAREPVAEPAPKEPAAREPAAEPAPKEPAAAASAEAAAGTVAPDPTRAAPLTKRALAMLERGNNKGAIELADASIEADSTDANAYLYKGTALLELGQRAAAKEVFGRCVQQAKRGPIHECRAFR